MLTADDRRPSTRWQRWSQQITEWDVDVVLRWSLVLSSLSLAVLCGLAIAGALWSVAAGLLRLVGD